MWSQEQTPATAISFVSGGCNTPPTMAAGWRSRRQLIGFQLGFSPIFRLGIALVGGENAIQRHRYSAFSNLIFSNGIK